MNDDLGDRMKDYEAAETSRKLDITLPVYARIDGRGFSKFTRGLRRPYDERMSAAMISATAHLVRHSGALIGYTQSDEISLGWHVDLDSNPLADMFFSGKVMKLSSVLASMATAAFTNAVLKSDDDAFIAYVDRLPHFDCRVFNLPSPDELANAFLWRSLDAERNSVSMAAYANFSPSSLYKISCRGMRAKLDAIGIDFESYPDFFKRGSFIRSQTVVRSLTAEELVAIPPNKRPAATATFPRTFIDRIDMPPFLDVANRRDVIYGAAPVLRDVAAAAEDLIDG